VKSTVVVVVWTVLQKSIVSIRNERDVKSQQTRILIGVCVRVTSLTMDKATEGGKCIEDLKEVSCVPISACRHKVWLKGEASSARLVKGGMIFFRFAAKETGV
jgi:hypothetical protein